MNKVAGDLYGTGLFEVLKCNVSRMELLSTALVFAPHAVVLAAGSDTLMDDKELIPTIAAVRKTCKDIKLIVVVMGTLKTEIPIPEGVDIIRYISSKQTAEEILIKMYTADKLKDFSNYNNGMESVIYEIVDELGITAKYSGQLYIVDALKAMLNGEISPNSSFSKSVYPLIAKKYNISPASAERSIRHAIVKSWEIIDVSSKNKYFGILYDINKNPGNREYLLIVYDKLKRMGL